MLVMGKLKICNSRTRPMVACYTYVQPNLSLELCSLVAKKSYRSAEFPNSAEKKNREFAIPTADKIVRLLPKGRKNSYCWKNINFCTYQFLSLCDNASCKLAFVYCCRIANSAGQREKTFACSQGRKNQPEPRVIDAGKRLRSVTVGRNELRHKTPSATSTLKECPNCNS